jgi:hypothetical protein
MEVVLLVHLHHFNAAMLATPAVPAISSTVAVLLQDQQMHITLRQQLYFCTNGSLQLSRGLLSGMTIGTSYMVTSGNGSCTWFICII